MRPTKMAKKSEAALAAAIAQLPKRITCPRCGKSRTREMFGLRVMKRDADGLPVQIYRQSYCKECRNG